MADTDHSESLLFGEVELMETYAVPRTDHVHLIVASLRRSGINGNNCDGEEGKGSPARRFSSEKWN